MDSGNFLGFSLPRSRSTWLSVALTSDKGYCYHDLSAEGNIGYIKNALWPNHGLIDTGMIHFVEEMDFTCPAIAIHRDPKEVRESLRKVGYEIGDIEGQAERLMHLHELYKGPVLHIDFEKIDQMGEVIWNHCKKEPFNPERWLRLCQMNIQVRL